MTVHDFQQFVNDSLLPQIMQERHDGISTNINIFLIFVYLFFRFSALLNRNGDKPEVATSSWVPSSADRTQVDVH